MYSILVLAGVSAGADVAVPLAPAPVAAYGCNGCYGSGYGSAYAGGCYGSCHGRGFGLFGRRASCHGCSGYSCSGYSCFGSCHGAPAYGYGYRSCNGSCYGSLGSVYGSYSYPAYPAVMAPPVVIPVETKPGETKFTPGTKPEDKDKGKEEKKDNDKDKEEKKDNDKKDNGKGNSDNLSANLTFQLPAEAKLYVDGHLTRGNGIERTFFTPPLQPGQKYYYEVKAELVVNGETITEEKRVIVSAGAEVTETFPKLTAAVGGKPAVLVNK